MARRRVKVKRVMGLMPMQEDGDCGYGDMGQYQRRTNDAPPR
jgi:hypothetical protein